MIVARFKVTCRPERAEEMCAALVAVEAPSRALEGVAEFDVARSLTDHDAFVVTEVFETLDAFDRQNALAEVAEVLRIAADGALVGDYEFARWNTA